jgi:uncharacterized membrane protein (UPF0127 family)
MKIRNLTKRFYIESEVANNLWKQIKGLSFSKIRNLFFLMSYERKWRIWMFGMRSKINIVFIDSKNIVVDVKKAEPLTLNPKSWKIYKPKKPCKYILETKDNRFRVGDRLGWKKKS